jgi:hypothetical protein
MKSHLLEMNITHKWENFPARAVRAWGLATFGEWRLRTWKTGLSEGTHHERSRTKAARLHSLAPVRHRPRGPPGDTHPLLTNREHPLHNAHLACSRGSRVQCPCGGTSGVRLPPSTLPFRFAVSFFIMVRHTRARHARRTTQTRYCAGGSA